VPQPYEAVTKRVASSTGLDPLTEDEAQAVLALARRVAHTSDDRRAAPLVCYLAGRVLGSSAAPADRLQRIADLEALFPEE
jgi:Domain of unknown function (DUF6457)